MPLSHAGLVISDDPEGDQLIIAAYAEKKKLWEEAKKNIHSPPQDKWPMRYLLGQFAPPSHLCHRSSPDLRPPQLLG